VGLVDEKRVPSVRTSVNSSLTIVRMFRVEAAVVDILSPFIQD
jgi:hypothetical protein